MTRTVHGTCNCPVTTECSNTRDVVIRAALHVEVTNFVLAHTSLVAMCDGTRPADVLFFAWT